MPKVHNIGNKHFVQLFRNPVEWGWKVVVRGETQEITEPFRMAKPIMIRLPFYRTLVIGKWVGQLEEEDALLKATGIRVLADEDFEEGWTAPAYKTGKESCEYCDSGFNHVGGECPLRDW